ncbi:hypothetical protein IJ843_05735 [bacterium]|nr:hypothetical protein [bacterium]
MAIEGFDYKQFANDLSSQAVELVPADFEPFQKDYVVKTLANFSNLAGEAISNDAEAGFNAEQAIFLTQIIAEWSFHKSVDVIRSGIQPEYWDVVLQKIAFTIFDIGKNTIKQNLPQDKILELVEQHVIKAYEAALEELQQRGIIDEELKRQAEQQNNLNQLMEQVQAEQQAQMEAEAAQQAQQAAAAQPPQGAPVQPQVQDGSERKVFKLASLALLLRTLSQDKVSSILNKFNPQDAQLVIQYMQMPDLNQRVDANQAIQFLKEIKTNLPSKRGTSPNQLIFRVKNSLRNATREKVEVMLKHERINVKRFVTSALQDELYELPPKVSNVIAQHIESSV